jgi:DNA-binding transcriptional ArsR family regulator
MPDRNLTSMNDRAFLSVFTPSRTPPDDLEAITVQRQALIQDAVERVRESATTGNKHHLLFVGPRGTGKTHLVTLLVHRLGQDRRLDDRLRIAWLNEDETSTSLLELLRRIYDALAKRYPAEFAPGALDPLFDLPPEAAEEALARLLLATLQGRTLLVLVENLDALFEGLGQAGQQRLRAFIQEHPVLSLVATAQRLVDDIAKRQSAFFGFFQTEHLKTLSVEEARALLQNIARLNRLDEVAAFLNGPAGRSRVRALHHLSGGNHRLYIVLSQFITRDSIQVLVDPFVKMVDEMTPYYQERIRWLPAQQRKIVEYLCTQERPVPVKQIARRLFATPQTVSGQLKDLRDKGYVLSAQRGRESLYEIAEPMMRLCVEVKENQTQTQVPMRVLVDFLRVWYDGRSDLQAQADADDSAVKDLYSAPLTDRVDAHLALSEIHVAMGRWDEAMTSLTNGLTEGCAASPAYAGDSTDLIGAFFDAMLQPALRRERAVQLFQVYVDANDVASLGQALVHHLGRLHAAVERPSPDNLETWASAWEEVGNGLVTFRLPLRLFRTGIDFLKTGGTDRGILLNLNQEERKLLEQVFGEESTSMRSEA